MIVDGSQCGIQLLDAKQGIFGKRCHAFEIFRAKINKGFSFFFYIDGIPMRPADDGTIGIQGTCPVN